MRLRTVPVSIATAAAVGLTACGGDDALSKPDLITKADSACRQAKVDLGKLPAPKTAKDVQTYANRAVAINDRTLARLKALTPPEEIAADYEKVTANVQEQSRLARDLGAAAGKRDTATIQRIATRGQKISAEGAQLSKRIGFKVCGAS